MASLIVRNIPDDVKERLRQQAAAKGRSMEAETRRILSDALEREDRKGESLGEFIARTISPENRVDLTPYLPPREPAREPPNFDE